MISKKTPDERLLDAQLDFIMNAPQEQLDAFLVETGADLGDMNRKATQAFTRAFDNHQQTLNGAEALARLTAPQQKVIAQNLGIRRQVLTAFREHRVQVLSVPAKFLRHLASELGQQVDALARALSGPAPGSLAVSHKSEVKPDTVPKQVTFEQLLREADMSDEEIGQLMCDGD